MKTIFIWDIENISVRRKGLQIMEKLFFKPNLLFAVSKRNPSKAEITMFEKFNIVHKQSETIADVLILKILKQYKDYDNFIIVSSDSDFCVFLNEINNKNIQWFLEVDKSSSVLKKTLHTNTSNNISYEYLPCKNKVENKTHIKPIIYQSFSEKEIKKYFLKENKSYLRENLNKLALKYKLDKYYLEDIVDKYDVPKEEIKLLYKSINNVGENITKLRNKFNALTHIIKQVSHRIEHYFSKRVYGQCVCCHQYNYLQNNHNFCNSCEEKFYLEFGVLKGLNHKEKLSAFQEKIIYEKETFGGIVYPIERIDLLKKELLLEYNLPAHLANYRSL